MCAAESEREPGLTGSSRQTVNWLGLHARSWISQPRLVEIYNRFFFFYTLLNERPSCRSLWDKLFTQIQ